MPINGWGSDAKHQSSASECHKDNHSPPVKNAFSSRTASSTICVTIDCGIPRPIFWYRRQANDICDPSSREIITFACTRPGIKPRCLSQKMEANEEEKKTPSTIANPIKRVLKSLSRDSIHRRHQSALALISGLVSTAENRRSCSSASGTSS